MRKCIFGDENEDMILYKYLSPDRIDVLSSGLIRYTQPGDFNDPFEVKPCISQFFTQNDVQAMMLEDLNAIIERQYNDLPPDAKARIAYPTFFSLLKQQMMDKTGDIHALIESFIPTFKAALQDKFFDALGILSLTEKPDNLLMWAHYAANHEGFVIGFDAENPYFHENEGKGEFKYLRQVEYRQVRPNGTLLELNGTDVLLVKSSEWQYEQEWRILRPLQEAAKVIELPKRYSINLFSYPVDAVQEVILGCRMSTDSKNKIVEALTSQPSLRHVQLLQAEPDEEHFKINVLSGIKEC